MSKRFDTSRCEPTHALAAALKIMDDGQKYASDRLDKRFARADACLAGEAMPPEEESFNGRIDAVSQVLSPEEQADFLIDEARLARRPPAGPRLVDAAPAPSPPRPTSSPSVPSSDRSHAVRVPRETFRADDSVSGVRPMHASHPDRDARLDDVDAGYDHRARAARAVY